MGNLLRAGYPFESGQGKTTAIQAYLDSHNQNPRIFVWTASVERILTKVAKCKEAFGTLHYHIKLGG